MYYPPTAFYFKVEILGVEKGGQLASNNDASFEEVSGMEVWWDVEEVVEGGENRFVHRLPRPAKHSNLVLKRGAVTQASYFAQWVNDGLGSRLLEPLVVHDILVTLLNEQGKPSIAWNFVNAYPVKCSMGPLNSMDNKILIETLEFSYNFFVRTVLTQNSSPASK